MADTMGTSGADYRHTQVGKPVLFGLGVIFVLELAIAVQLRFHPMMVGLLVVVALGALIFGWLTVSVNREEVRLRFGPGPVGKRFRVADIRDAKVVRNRWWYGWGIRLTPHGWLYNVSGLSAVEIRLDSGKRVRIGTDEPERLKQAIDGVRRG
jgi:hypothetical protein